MREEETFSKDANRPGLLTLEVSRLADGEPAALIANLRAGPSTAVEFMAAATWATKVQRQAVRQEMSPEVPSTVQKPMVEIAMLFTLCGRRG